MTIDNGNVQISEPVASGGGFIRGATVPLDEDVSPDAWDELGLVADDDEEWPAHYGAARLGIP